MLIGWGSAHRHVRQISPAINAVGVLFQSAAVGSVQLVVAGPILCRLLFMSKKAGMYVGVAGLWVV